MAWLVPLGLAASWLGAGAAAYLHHPVPREQNTSHSSIEVNINFGPRVSPLPRPTKKLNAGLTHVFFKDPFAYMVDNTYNTHGVAPDKG
jgi:hypothetical protein